MVIKFDNEQTDEIKLSIAGGQKTAKLDSGDDLWMEIQFQPTTTFKRESADRRYEISLHVVNANTQLFIPILVLSPNPAISFPNEIHLPNTALNTPFYSNITVLNYSSQCQKFSFECLNNVKIIPDCKCVLAKAFDAVTFLLELVPRAVGSFREKIQMNFDSGRKTVIVMKGNVIPVNIFLGSSFTYKKLMISYQA